MSHFAPNHQDLPVDEEVRRERPDFQTRLLFIEVVLAHRLRRNLHRWAARYAKADHAKEHVKETRLLIQEIDALLLKE